MTKRHLARSLALGCAAVFGTMNGTARAEQKSLRDGEGPSAAAGAPDGNVGLEDIVVTAQRREESLQKIPISVSTATETALREAGITDTMRLDQVIPNLKMTRVAGYQLPRIRGIGNSITSPGAENSVATYIDGIYIASVSGSMITLNNIARVEVLKGPQGTLFGRNATGGLIQIITRDPQQEFSGTAHIGLANYQAPSADLYVTKGLSDSLAADLAVAVSAQRKGFGTNFFTGEGTNRVDRDIALRTKLKIDIDPQTIATIALDYQNRQDRNFLFTPLAGFPPALYRGIPYPPIRTGTPYDVDTDTVNDIYLRGGGGSLTVRHELGWANFSSISSYRKARLSSQVDADAGPQPNLYTLVEREDHNYTQEFQLGSTKGSGVNWIAGIYYYNGEYQILPQGSYGLILAPNRGAPAFNRGRTISLAGYGQATYEILPRTNITAGLRYLYEKRNATFQSGVESLSGVITLGVPAKRSVDVYRATWRLAVDHEFTDDILGYISFNRGFKSGGFNLTGAPAAPYKPEVLDSYEAGLKMQFFDDKVRLNLSAFDYKYSNIQITQYLPNATTAITNGAKATLYGFDLDFETRPIPELSVRASLGYVHSNFDEYTGAPFYDLNPLSTTYLVSSSGDATGNELPLSPDLTGQIGMTYVVPTSVGEISLSGNVAYSSGWFSDANNQRPLKQPAYTLANISIGWVVPNGKYSIRLWCDNITDKYYSIQYTVTASRFVNQVPGKPRTYGVTAGVTF